MGVKPKVPSDQPKVLPETTPAPRETHTASGASSGQDKSPKPKLAPKPQLAPKPKLAPKPELVQKQTVEPLNAMRIESDNILKYITDNTIDIGSDLDLFS